jgi:hypothetical protein
MPSIPEPTDPLWEEFLKFLEPSELPKTGDDATAELRKLGIDPAPGQVRVVAAARRARARAELAAAKQKAAVVQTQLAAVPSTLEQLSRDRIKQLILDRCDKEAQHAYFRKLDASSTDDDLRAILVDLDCLKHIVEGQVDGDKSN